MLRNLSFSGYENCGAENVGAQMKTAPDAKLASNKDGNLVLTRYDADPPKATILPSYFVNLRSETTSDGAGARLNFYCHSDRYLPVATGVPTSGITPTNSGTLLAFSRIETVSPSNRG